MHLLDNIIGKKVVDVSGAELGIFDGLILVLPKRNLYMTIRGDRVLAFRGNVSELIPANEIEVIADSIHLLKTFEGLKAAITMREVSSSDVVRVNGLVGLSVKSSDGLTVGNITNIGLSEERMELYVILEGENVKKMRGHDKEAISLREIDSIGNNVKIDIPYNKLVEEILLRRTYLK
jgi:sporulation protein YlmC with PRC-barrel domain